MRAVKDTLIRKIRPSSIEDDFLSTERTTDATARRRDFVNIFVSPFLPSGKERPALWGIDPSNDHILGWRENGSKLVDAPWPDASPPVSFIEGESEWLYSVHATGTLGGANQQIKRWKVSGAGTSIISLSTLIDTSAWPTGYSAPQGQSEILINPDGEVFLKLFKAWTEVAFTRRTRESWWKLSASGADWTLTQEVEAPEPVDDYLIFVSRGLLSSDPHCQCFGHFCTFKWSTGPYGTAVGWNTEETLLTRVFKETILNTGNWIAAEPIPGTLSEVGVVLPYEGGAAIDLGMQVTGPEVVCACQKGNFGACPGDTSEFPLCTARIWGDSWWERGTSSWVGVTNTGLSTQTAFMGMNVSGPAGGFETSTLDSVFTNIRVSQDHNILPSVDFKSGSLFDSTTTVPHQNVETLRADGIYVFMFLRGGTDASNAYHPGGVFRATIPAAGSTPSWTQLLIEPDLDTGTEAWQDLSATDNFIWISETTGDGSIRLVRYDKDGSNRTVIQTFTSDSSTLNIQTGWTHQWK